MSVLSVRDLQVHLGECPLLADISFSLSGGELLALIGPNGAGKSSLIHSLIGDHPLAGGELSFAGRPLAEWSLQQRARHIALLPQLSLLNFPFTVDEVVALGRSPHSTGLTCDRQIITEVCAATDIQHLRQRRYTQLSGGERQRVQLARTLAQIWRAGDGDPRLLLLDEATAALDIGHQRLVMETVQSFAKAGGAVVFVAHDISLAARYADQMIALRQGRVVAQGTAAEVVTEATIGELFETPVSVLAHPETGRPVLINA